MADEITTSDLVDTALAPASTTNDGQTVVSRPVADLIALDKHLANKRAAPYGFSALGRQQIRPSSATGE